MDNHQWLGKDVIARGGTFAGVIIQIDGEGEEMTFTIKGYSTITEQYGLIKNVKPEDVIPIFEENEHL